MYRNGLYLQMIKYKLYVLVILYHYLIISLNLCRFQKQLLKYYLFKSKESYFILENSYLSVIKLNLIIYSLKQLFYLMMNNWEYKKMLMSKFYPI